MALGPRDLARSAYHGAQLLTLRDESFPIVHFTVAFRHGAETDAPGALGAMSTLLPLLLRGTEGRDRAEFNGALEALGIRIAFSTTAVILAQTFVALPFLVLSLEGALRSAGERYESVAATLGARPSTVLRRVTLPLILPGLLSGAILSFARALGEFGAVSVVSGRILGQTQTLPLFVEDRFNEFDLVGAYTASVLLAVIGLFVLALMIRLQQRKETPWPSTPAA